MSRGGSKGVLLTQFSDHAAVRSARRHSQASRVIPRPYAGREAVPGGFGA